jgi:hypothetical protein
MDVSNNVLIQILIEDVITFNNADNFNEDFSAFPIFPFYNSPVNSHQTILHQSLYDRNPIKNVVTSEIADGLLPIKFKDAKDKENNETCSITMEFFKEDDEVIQLPCNHCFLVEPIMQWLTEESSECPVCRYKFESMEKNTRLEEEIVGVVNLPEELIQHHNLILSQIINGLFSGNAGVYSEPENPMELDADVDLDVD